jgi:hypothetical protein
MTIEPSKTSKTRKTSKIGHKQTWLFMWGSANLTKSQRRCRRVPDLLLEGVDDDDELMVDLKKES